MFCIFLFVPCSIWGSLHVCIFNVIVLLLAISHIRASFSDPGEMDHVYSLCDFTADICQTHIGLETCLKRENLADMNPVKDKLSVSNLSDCLLSYPS